MEPSRITAPQAEEQLKRGEKILFLDVRNPNAWAQSGEKLPGAKRIALDEIELHSHHLSRDHCIITYCT